MRKLKRITALIMAIAVMLSFQPTFSNASAKVSKKGYTISKAAGTYSDSVSIKITAKKGYKVYYSLNGKLTTSKVIKSKKSKTLTITTTKTLTIYAVKTSKKITNKILKKSSTIKKAKTYQYTISSDAKETTSSNQTTSEADSTSTESSEATKATEEVTVTEATETKSTAGTITRNATDSEATSGDGYEISVKGVLKITESGDYTISGTYKKISIKSNANITLNNVTIKSDSLDPDEGLIDISKGLDVNIIVPEGTASTLTDTSPLASSDADEPNGICAGKNGTLNISGSGTLNITSSHGNGIKAKNILNITDTTIIIGTTSEYVAGKGIAAKNEINLNNANLTIYSVNDGIKTTYDEDDVTFDTSTYTYDSSTTTNTKVNIKGGKIVIKTKDGDGISASYKLFEDTRYEVGFGTVTIDDATVDIVTGAVTSTTYEADGRTIDYGSHKGIKAGTDITINSGNITIDTTKANITNNRSGDEYADDAIHSNGTMTINGGTINISSSDDGIHAEVKLTVNAGDVTVNNSYEGVESMSINIIGGNVNVTATDDGMNASGGLATQVDSEGSAMSSTAYYNGQIYNYELNIKGGEVTVNSEGDGLDSNGSLYISGGTTKVFGPSNGGNAAFDIGEQNCTFSITGGTVIATAGSSDMSVAPNVTTGQSFVVFSTSLSANSNVTVSDGTTFTVPKTSSYVFVSSSGIQSGTSYTLTSGSISATATGGVNTSGGFGGPGDMGIPGNMGGPGWMGF